MSRDLKKMYKTIMDDNFPPNMEVSFVDGDNRQTLFYEKVSWAIDDVLISGIKDAQNPEISLLQPKETTIYLNGEELAQWPFPTLIIGPIEFTFDVTDEESGVDYIELFMNTELKITLDSEPYSWVWNEGGIGIYTIKATGFDYIGNSASTNELMVIKIQLF